MEAIKTALLLLFKYYGSLAMLVNSCLYCCHKLLCHNYFLVSADNLPSPASTSLSLKFDFDSASVIDTKSEYGALSAAKDNVSIVESDQLDGLSGLMIGELVSSSESELCLSTMDQESITQTEGK